MKPFHGFLLQPRRPAIFNPKVTPDPTDAEKLEAKLQEAAQQLVKIASRHSMYSSIGGGHYATRR